MTSSPHGPAVCTWVPDAGTGPMYELCQKFGVPSVSTGVGNAESNNHAPNENIILEDYIQGIKHIAAIMDRFATI